MREIKYIVVHCSDTPNDMNVSAETIHGWHLQNGWDGIGYHDVIRRDGHIEAGRPKYWKGSHVKNYNSKSIGICLIGRDEFTSIQMNVLKLHIRGLLMMHPEAKVVGHYELDPKKTCPNINMDEFRKTL